jgi:regulator of protease activity HflC (stomatin/prohibitin superfamily)
MNFTVINNASMYVLGLFFLWILIKFLRSIRIVPTQSSYIVERCGKYHRTLDAGFHALIPFMDEVSFIQDLKEVSIVVEPQECFTRDNVKVEVDGVLYLSVMDPVKASYGVTDFNFAATQLVQTTTRSVIGQISLDKTFEERDMINSKVIEVLTEVESTWGIRVHRYEVKNIVPPRTVQAAMERQMTAERERRAIIATSEGAMASLINESEGMRQEMINKAEGVKRRLINEAEGKSEEILSISKATAESIIKIAEAVCLPQGEDALRMRLGRRLIDQMEHLQDPSTKVMLPKDLSSIKDWLKDLDTLPSVLKD